MPRFRMYPLEANKVLELYEQRDLIDLEPPYQRLSVWDQEKQQRFIDSVINEVDTPKLYFHDLTMRSSRLKFSVIDGKQRLLALWAFISNELPLPSDFLYFDNESYDAGQLTYEELLIKFPLLRARFDAFRVPIILVDAESDVFIEQLFSRLNVQVPLSAPEARNVMGGPLPLLIRKIGLTDYFRKAVVLKNTRFQHYNLSIKFLYIAHRDGFVSTKKRDLDDFVRNMKQARDKGEEVASDQSLLVLEDRVVGELDRSLRFFGERNPLLRSVGRMTLYFHLFRLCCRACIDPPISLPMLVEFNRDVVLARQKSQRRSLGSDEALSDLENILVRFDGEKQSVNDGVALRRQYDYLRDYMKIRHEVELPD